MRYLYQNKYWSINKEYNIDKLLYLMIDRPNYITVRNEIVWSNSTKQDHREYDLPASCIYLYSNKMCNLYWRKNNKYYRKNNKPSYIDYNGNKEYHINGKFLKRENLR